MYTTIFQIIFGAIVGFITPALWMFWLQFCPKNLFYHKKFNRIIYKLLYYYAPAIIWVMFCGLLFIKGHTFFGFTYILVTLNVCRNIYQNYYNKHSPSAH